MRFCVSLLCSMTALVGLSAATLAREQPLAALVPAEAIVYLATPDVELLDRQWTGASFYRLWQDDALRDFRSSFYEATRFTAGMSWQQLLDVASGEACLALLPVGEQDTGFLLLVDVSQHAEKAAALVDELREQYAKADDVVRICFLEAGVLGVTNREEIGRRVLEWLANPQAESLASSETFRAVGEHSRAAAGDAPLHLTWYLDPWAFQSVARQAGAANADKTWQRLAGEGFQVIRAAGGAMSFATAEHDLKHHWFVFAPGEREKAARMLDFSSLAELELPSWIPANVDSVLSVHWSLAAALAGYGSWFDANWAEGEAGTFEAVLEDIRTEPDGPQVDIAELLKLQAGPVLSMSAAVETFPGRRSEMVYAMKLESDQQPAEALPRMFQTDEGVRRASAGEHEMWVFDEADPDGAAASSALGPDLSGYAISVAHGYLYVATSETLLKQLLSDPKAAKYVDDDSYRQLQTESAPHRPESCIGWRVSPQAAGLRPLYESFRTGGAVDLGQLLGDDPSDEHGVDFSKLPAGDILPKFIAAGFGFVSQLDDGWLLGGYVLKSSE